MSPRRKAKRLRARKVRADASISAAEKWIAKMCGVPNGSVRLIYPSGRKARIDSDIQTLRDRWENN